MIRIAAVDDERHVLERFERMIQGHSDIALCGLFETGEALLDYMAQHPLDAVFLDIEMPGLNGLEISARLLELNHEIDIVFVTAFNQYAIEAFEVEAMDYILKPLTETRLNKILQRLLKKSGKVQQVNKPFIQCFGDFEVFLGREALAWKHSKAKEILAFLVHKSGVPVNWDKIADAVWPEFNAEKAQTNFHATTYLLRKRLAEAGISQILESGRGNYRIVMDQVTCDLYQLEVMIQNQQVKRKEDLMFIEKLAQRGYMEASGYTWAQGKAAELETLCQQVLHEHV